MDYRNTGERQSHTTLIQFQPSTNHIIVHHSQTWQNEEKNKVEVPEEVYQPYLTDSILSREIIRFLEVYSKQIIRLLWKDSTIPKQELKTDYGALLTEGTKSNTEFTAQRKLHILNHF